MAEKMFTIKAISAELGLSEVYIRRMIQQKKLQTTKIQISENVWRHEVSESDLQAWRNNSSSRSVRSDGRNKFVVYLTTDEMQKLDEILKQANFHLEIERANKPEDVKRRYVASKIKKAKAKA